jgi:hypothetical protein
MIAGLSELMLTGNQQMIRQHPNEQMPGGSVCLLMIHRKDCSICSLYANSSSAMS